jgi:hypothetical protein
MLLAHLLLHARIFSGPALLMFYQESSDELQSREG